MTFLCQYFVIAAFVQQASAAFCGSTAIPFRFEVTESGDFVLGCATPSCMCAEPADDSQFNPNSQGADGFLREGDASRQNYCANIDIYGNTGARCSGEFHSSSCSGLTSWTGGIVNRGDGTIGLQCCSYDGMRFSAEVGRPVVHQGEVYSGGEVIRDGRQTGFDLISNIKKIQAQDSSVAYELTVHRMNCLPNPPEKQNAVDFKYESEIVKIQDKVLDQGPELEAPISNDQVVQIGEAAVPVQSPGYYYPVAGVPACFAADTMVKTEKNGLIRIDELKVGDLVEVAHGNTTSFDEVISFLHRLPETIITFVRLQLIDGTEIKLTPQHFIHKVNCVASPIENVQQVYASEVAVDDCLLKKSMNNTFKATKVAVISTTKEKGAYSPMTASGTIVVNNVMASCHNVVRSEILSQTFFKAILRFEKTIRSFFARLNDGNEKEVHLPFGVEFVFKRCTTSCPTILLTYTNKNFDFNLYKISNCRFNLSSYFFYKLARKKI